MKYLSLSVLLALFALLLPSDAWDTSLCRAATVKPVQCLNCGNSRTCPEGACVAGSDRSKVYNTREYGCFRSIPGCWVYKADSTCYTCHPGYYLHNNQCNICNMPFCTSCLSPGVCNSCSAGKPSMDKKACFYCVVGGCDSCTGVNVCGKCLAGYVLNNGACIPCADNDCAMCSAATTYAPSARTPATSSPATSASPPLKTVRSLTPVAAAAPSARRTTS
ncbi:hypothetical protein ADEAN_000130700 [Angomonas deanei]|uniref:Uncharacterized protein n=1 Tax=Angomonas deanei TaxID=59799 RepID=A0A7G2C3M1_9TRYP|nr:hypothetical protein ADEAN_000130700 [Angomonas deanei]